MITDAKKIEALKKALAEGKKLGYNHFCLTTTLGDALNSYNSINKPVKFEEMALLVRQSNLDFDQLCLSCKPSPRAKSVDLNLGKYVSGKSQKKAPEPTTIISASSEVDLDEHLELVRQNSRLEIENRTLLAQNEMLTERINELTEELNQLSLNDNGGNSGENYEGALVSTLKQLPAILDGFYENREKDRELKQMELMAKFPRLARMYGFDEEEPGQSET